MNPRYLSQVELWKFKLIYLGESDFGFMTSFIFLTLWKFFFLWNIYAKTKVYVYVYTHRLHWLVNRYLSILYWDNVCLHFSTWNLPMSLLLINFASTLGFGKVILNNVNQRFSSTACQHQHVYFFQSSHYIQYMYIEHNF